MSWNSIEKNIKNDSLPVEAFEFSKENKELQNKIQYFEYKNKSRNWEYYVFSYNAVTWENVDDIRRKYVQQYWWKTNWILITNDIWEELPEREFSQQKKIYLKIKISDNPKPIRFIEAKKLSNSTQYDCHIKTMWRTPVNIRQIYQDENNMVIEKDKFIISDGNGNIYSDSKRFEPWDVIKIEIKKSDSNGNNKNTPDITKQNSTKKRENLQKNAVKKNAVNKSDKEMSDTIKWKTNYKGMIENQKSPITIWNRNRPEISITFDDGYWIDCIKHILDTLKWSGIKATFFILWDCLRNTPELWKKAAKEWHQICCHTFSHIYLSDSSDITNLTSGLNRGINIKSRENNVKSLLWTNYYNKIKSGSWTWFPNKIKSTILLRTEILMWEAQIKKTLWESYLKNLKQNYPFFRFPWWCWASRSQNIAVLKSLWYLSIWWSEDFYKWSGSNRRHLTPSEMQSMNISNWNIPLFHFKKDDYKYIDAYIQNMKRKWKSSKVVSRVISK